jgi:hypothetical protein
MKYIYTISIVILINFCAKAQVEINHSIIPPINDSLEIKNVGIPKDSTGLVNLKDIRQHTYLFFNANLINDSLGIIMDTNLIKIKKGLLIYVKCNAPNIGTPKMSINGQSFLITKNNNGSLDSADILTDKILVLICNDTSFNLMNPERPPCPSGFSQVNENYCIQINESTGNFWKASRTCQKLGYRLCSWSEWYYACYHSATLGLNNMTNNWEMINQAQNEENMIKVVGLNSCETSTHGLISSQSNFYRCCFNF